MDTGIKRHSKKNDKETQSPVLKVFKEMIQRENKDPEKANLLKEKQENRKRRQYSGSRTKSDRNQRSCDSSSSEKHMRNVQYKGGTATGHQPLQDYQARSQNVPFQDDKKDSWWFWGETEKKKSEDTCSCVSCALKRIAGSEYTCIACLGVIFLISVLVAFMVLFKTVPMVAKEKAMPKKSREVSSDILKRKIEMLQKGYGDETLRSGNSERRLWDDTMNRHLSSLTGLNGNDFDDGSFRETNNLEESVMRSDNELSSVLDTDKLNDGLSSDRLRNFYRKLIQTDAQIRNLKKSVNDFGSLKNIDVNKLNMADRPKRSLKLRRPKSLLSLVTKEEATPIPAGSLTELHNFNIFYPPVNEANATSKKYKKPKRSVNGTEEPTGFLIEKKQILVQYKPHSLKKVPKCSHAPKESKSHEKQLKHPFYKNTQRLDELLDQFLDRNLPEMMLDPFGVEVLFNKNKNDKFKTYKTNLNIETERQLKKPFDRVKEKEVFSVKPKHRPVVSKEYFNVVTSKHQKGDDLPSSTSAYDVLLSVSTIVNPGLHKVTKSVSNIPTRTPSLLERVPHIRKLLQMNEEGDEALGYEDLKKVLDDENENQDETEMGKDRNKRMEDYYNEETSNKVNDPSKLNTAGFKNPYKKVSVPLNPDEIGSMIKQAAIQNINNVKIPVNTKDVSAESDDAENDLSDVEYIENYADNKYDKLVRMAQAYSDYGVLEGKKELVKNGNGNEPKSNKGVDRIVQLSVNKGKSLKDALLTRFKKRNSPESEGIRFEFKPTTNARDDSPTEIIKALRKHVKVTTPGLKIFQPQYQPPNHEFTLMNSGLVKGASNQRVGELVTRKLDAQNDYPTPLSGSVYNLAKNGKRSLVSDSDVVDVANKDDDGYVSEIVAEKTTAKEEIQDEYADNSIVFTLAKKTKSINDGVKNEYDSFNEDMIKIGKRSLMSVDYDESNSSVKTSEDNLDKHNGSTYKSFDKSLRGIESLNITTNITEAASEQKLTKQVLVNADTSHKQKRDATNNGTVTDFNAPGSLGDAIVESLIGPLNKNITSPEMDFGEFFRMMATWFGLLAEADRSNSDNITTQKVPESNIIKFTTTKHNHTTPKTNASQNVEYPMYDSDMIENIGHRSRVLMAVDDNVSTGVEVNASSIQEQHDDSTVSSDTTEEIITIISTLLFTKEQDSPNTNLLTSNKPTTKSMTENVDGTSKIKDAENKTIVKRDVEGDSNFIFWNDMYDDEYGIKLDPIDNAIGDKHYVKGMDFMKKSGYWIQDKVRNFANNFRKEKDNDSRKRRVLRGAKFVGSNPYSERIRDKYVKRDVRYSDDYSERKTNSFAALTAKMKEVCKEAAKAVQQTRNLKVRENEKEDSMSSSLMQQLVRLMSDLVDFQVQQKTCVKLPPDLQEFLEWLTAPNPEQMDLKNSKLRYHDDDSYDKSTDQVLDVVTTPSSEKEEVHAHRSDCLGTLHAVQDLMQQFDEMADEDKSKMTGIREYLENQLQFLHKQLATYDDYKMPSSFDEESPLLRFRRGLTRAPEGQKFRNHSSARRRRFKRKFLKNFGKKHTRTTASIYDGYPITEMKKFDEVNDGYEKRNDGNKELRIEKRNLRDVYYKALEDAKKSTTFKTMIKDELEGFDNAQIVRIEN